VGLIPNNLN